MEGFLHRPQIDGGPVFGDHLEIVDPDRFLLTRRPDVVRHLADDLEAHVLEHRQNVRKMDRAPGQIDLEAHLVFVRLDRAIEIHGEPPAGQSLFDAIQVEDGRMLVEVLLVAGRKGLGIAAQAADAPLLAMGVDQGTFQSVRPRAGGVDQQLLQGRHVDRGNRTGRRCDRDMKARQHRFAQLRGERGDLAAERLRQNLLEPRAQFGVVAVARDIDETRHEALEGIAAHEQRHPLAFLQMKDAHRGLEQLVVGNLEQFVARVGLQDVHQGLAVVAAAGKSGALDHAVDLVTQQRDIAGTARIGDRGEQAGEKMLADYRAGLVEDLHRDRIHMNRTVDRRLPVGLGNSHQLRLREKIAHLRRLLAQSA